MDNPAFVAASGAAAAAAAGIPEWVPHPGFLISTRAEMNLQLMCCFLHYREHMLHVTITADITLAAVRSIRGYKRWEESHEDNLLRSTIKIGPIPLNPLMSGCVDAWERHLRSPLPTSYVTLWLSWTIQLHPLHGPARLMSLLDVPHMVILWITI